LLQQGLKVKTSRPVYSTKSGRLCPGCGHPKNDCQCSIDNPPAGTGKAATIWLERKGRGGKEVSVIRDLPLRPMELQLLASTLKKQCGSGGTVSNGCIEVQGNHRDTIKRYLEQQGHAAKLAGS